MSALVIPANYSVVGLGLTAQVFLNVSRLRRSVAIRPPALRLFSLLDQYQSLSFQIWQSIRVGKARKMAGVNYPTMLVSEADAKADKKKHIYNCVQRSHGNTLENTPFILALTAYLGE